MCHLGGVERKRLFPSPGKSAPFCPVRLFVPETRAPPSESEPLLELSSSPTRNCVSQLGSHASAIRISGCVSPWLVLNSGRATSQTKFRVLCTVHRAQRSRAALWLWLWLDLFLHSAVACLMQLQLQLPLLCLDCLICCCWASPNFNLKKLKIQREAPAALLFREGRRPGRWK